MPRTTVASSAAVIAATLVVGTAAAPVASFAKRDGAKITVDGTPIRFGGLNA